MTQHTFILIVCPKKKSKILADVDEEAEGQAIRARNFQSKCERIQDIRKKRRAKEEVKKAKKAHNDDPRRFGRDELDKTLRQHGSIADKDLAVEIEQEDWENLYQTNYTQFEEGWKEKRRLEEVKSAKLQNYIFRE